MILIVQLCLCYLGALHYTNFRVIDNYKLGARPNLWQNSEHSRKPSWIKESDICNVISEWNNLDFALRLAIIFNIGFSTIFIWGIALTSGKYPLRTNLQLEIQSLKKLREHYEQQLRIFGLDLCDVPDDVTALLDECVELQRATNLHELEEHYLREFYYLKQKERIDNNLTIAKMQAEIKEQEVQLAKETAECATLEKFTTAVNKRLVSEAEMQRNKIMLETKIKTFQDRQNSLNIPEDLSIDELIKKIELLKRNKTKDK